MMHPYTHSYMYIHSFIHSFIQTFLLNSSMGSRPDDPILGYRRGSSLFVLCLCHFISRRNQKYALSTILASILVVCHLVPHWNYRRVDCLFRRCQGHGVCSIRWCWSSISCICLGTPSHLYPRSSLHAHEHGCQQIQSNEKSICQTSSTTSWIGMAPG